MLFSSEAVSKAVLHAQFYPKKEIGTDATRKTVPDQKAKHLAPVCTAVADVTTAKHGCFTNVTGDEYLHADAAHGR
ncbi:hypothetical protein D3C84_1086970 [compost metagenome]